MLNIICSDHFSRIHILHSSSNAHTPLIQCYRSSPRRAYTWGFPVTRAPPAQSSTYLVMKISSKIKNFNHSFNPLNFRSKIDKACRHYVEFVMIKLLEHLIQVTYLFENSLKIRFYMFFVWILSFRRMN